MVIIDVVVSPEAFEPFKKNGSLFLSMELISDSFVSHNEYILSFAAPDICISQNVSCNQPHGSCLAQPQTKHTECVCHVGYKNSPQCLPGNSFTMIVSL